MHRIGYASYLIPFDTHCTASFCLALSNFDVCCSVLPRAVCTLRAISSSANTINSIVVVDTPGLQNPSSCGRPGGATFDEFCFNYGQERLQLLFHEQTFIHERDRYAQVRWTYCGGGSPGCHLLEQHTFGVTSRSRYSLSHGALGRVALCLVALLAIDEAVWVDGVVTGLLVLVTCEPGGVW